MGNYNQHDIISDHHQGTSKWLKLTNNRKQREKLNKDDFIIEHIHNNKHNSVLMDINTLDPRRMVFVSLIGLYQTWNRVPSVALYTAMFILPLKREWLYCPGKYKDQIESALLSQHSLLSDSVETHQFVRLLKWKDSQGLVFWMLDYKQPRSDTIIMSFWYYLSERLSNLYDPATGGTYNPLILDEKYWKTYDSKYDTKTSSILAELFFFTMKFDTVREILHQSNPNSFILVKSYVYGMNDYSISNARKDALYDDISDDEEKSHWVFFDEYNPYDLDIDIDSINNEAYDAK